MVDLGAALVAIAVVAGQVVAWLVYRGRLRRAADRMDVRLAHQVGERQRLFDAEQDGLLQDLQGLALSLQAIAEQASSSDPTKRQLEGIIERIEAILAARRSFVQGAHHGGGGPG